MKYGFVYVWFDRKLKRFYIGRHWGSEDDGYICSSPKMRANHRNRSSDFKRRIVSRVYTTRDDLVDEEQRWLDMIDRNADRYYNVSLNAKAPSMRGRRHSEETKRKISLKAQGRCVTEEAKTKIRSTLSGRKLSDEHRAKIKANHRRDYSDPEWLSKMKLHHQNRSEETRKKIGDNSRRLQLEGKIGMKGRKHSEETKRKMSESSKNRRNK